MAFYEDAEIARDKQSVKDWKDTFDNIITDANAYIDKITQDRWGDLTRYVTHINLLKSHMEALKIKYPSEAIELDGFITSVEAQVTTVQARWNTEVYNKLNP